MPGVRCGYYFITGSIRKYPASYGCLWGYFGWSTYSYQTDKENNQEVREVIGSITCGSRWLVWVCVVREIARGRAPFILGKAQLFYEPGSFVLIWAGPICILMVWAILLLLSRVCMVVCGCGCEKHGMWMCLFHLLYSGLCCITSTVQRRELKDVIRAPRVCL